MKDAVLRVFIVEDAPRAATSVTMRMGHTPALNFAVFILRAAWSIVPKTQLKSVTFFE